MSDELASALLGYGRRSAGRQKATRHGTGASGGGALNAKDPAWGACRVLYRTSQSCIPFLQAAPRVMVRRAFRRAGTQNKYAAGEKRVQEGLEMVKPRFQQLNRGPCHYRSTGNQRP